MGGGYNNGEVGSGENTHKVDMEDFDLALVVCV